MNKKFILGIYDDEETLVHAAEKISKKVDIYDIYTPFPVHGLDDLLKIKRSWLPYVTFGAGAFGLLFALLFQSWVSAVDWPLNIGGKPFLSIPAFIPVAFEITVLFGALATVGAFFAVGKLFPSKKEVLFDQRQTCHKFVLAIEHGDYNADDVQKDLRELGATEVKIS